MYPILNFILHILHIGIIVGSIGLCFVNPKLHLAWQAVILFSWLVIGPVLKKPGMCILTEAQIWLHKQRGKDFPAAYLTYIYRKLGLSANNQKTVNGVTYGVFAASTLISVVSLIQTLP